MQGGRLSLSWIGHLGMGASRWNLVFGDSKALGVALMLSKMCLGRWKVRLSRCQLPWWSQKSQTLRESSFLIRGPWIKLRREPLPIQLSCQKLADAPFPIHHLVPKEQMRLVLRRLSQVIDSFLDVGWFRGYLLWRVAAQGLFELVCRAHALLARRVCFRHNFHYKKLGL